jgi:hypothetical protein
VQVCNTSQVLGGDACTVGVWHEGSATSKSTVEEGTACRAGCSTADGQACPRGDLSWESGGACGHGESRERCNGQVGTSRAGCNEACCEGEDGTDAERGVERGRNGSCLGGSADECLMTGFNSHDFCGNSKDTWGLDERRSGEVGRDTNVLEDTGCGNHGLGGGEAEVVCARLDRLGTGTSDRSGESGYVGCFRTTDGLEVSDVCWLETESSEV